MGIRFEKEILENKVLNPMKDFQLDTRAIEVRIDPLTGHTSRVVDRFGKRAPSKSNIDAFLQLTRDCFFCAEKVEVVTPRIMPEISSEERIKVGEAILFPNMTAYSNYSAVCIYSTQHFIEIGSFKPELIANNLKAHRRYIKLVAAYDPTVSFCSIIGNYLPPSGGSVIHPHLQSSVDKIPTNQELEMISCSEGYCQENGSSFWDDLVEAERNEEERFIGSTGQVSWLASFAPIGFNEIRAVVADKSRITDLGDDDIESLAMGISAALKYYGANHVNSFNLAIYSGPLRGDAGHFRVNLRLISRSTLEPWYRSDATGFERLFWEPITDRRPEEFCADIRPYFR
ncbi:MAG: hypothetical protein M1343_05200 [Chloroflexi bacterium]|nr:hypothetical protein [Chloroflexota bacterium]